MMLPLSIFQTVLALVSRTVGQETTLSGPQCQDWASHYSLSDSEISRAGLSNVTASNFEIALNYERTNWATGSVTDDPVYRVAVNYSTSIPAGTFFGVENATNTSLYTVPAAISLSRFTYQSLTMNGTGVPASGYILWPYLARKFANISGLPVVGWGHGTSGVFSECAPSHMRNLWYQYDAPFVLALQGYVVVAPDYAGIGIGSSNTSTQYDEDDVKHPWLAGPAQANDILYAITAAQAAFPSLSSSFIIMGHSQGGTAAWSAAAAVAATSHLPSSQHHHLLLGTVSASPGPGGDGFIQQMRASSDISYASVYAAAGILAQYPALPRSHLFTEAGLRRFELFEALGACSNSAQELFATPDGVDWVHGNASETWAARAYAARIEYAGKAVGGGGPMLVLSGSADPVVPATSVGSAFNRTCEAHPRSKITLASFEGVSHVPVLYAGQRVWLDWIADRFAGVPVDDGCKIENYTSVRDVGLYQKEMDYFLELATAQYQT